MLQFFEQDVSYALGNGTRSMKYGEKYVFKAVIKNNSDKECRTITSHINMFSETRMGINSENVKSLNIEKAMLEPGQGKFYIINNYSQSRMN